MIKLTAKVYGAEDHRQRTSFAPSSEIRWREITKPEAWDGVIITRIKNSDQTGTNEYSIVEVIAETEQDALKELLGQISDGAFENCRVGYVEIHTEEMKEPKA